MFFELDEQLDQSVFTIKTPYGNCFASFPDNSTKCVISGEFVAVSYFNEKLAEMTGEHGHKINLDNIEPSYFLDWCNNATLGIEILPLILDENLPYLEIA